MDAAKYKHVVLGLIFLKYISDAFEESSEEIKKEGGEPEDKDEYEAKNVFWVPKNARWDYLQKNAKQPKIGTIIDDAMDSIEKENSSLKGVLPKDYARPGLDKQRLGEIIDLIGSIALIDKSRNRTGEILFIDGQKLGVMLDRKQKELTQEDIAKIAKTYHAFRQKERKNKATIILQMRQAR